MPMTTGDLQYISDIITALNNYATTMTTFTGAAAGTAQTNLASALATATATHNTTVNQQGE